MSGTAVAAPTQRQSGRELLPDSVFDKLVNRIVKDYPTFSQGLAERIVDQAAAFLAAAAGARQPLSPSGVVDVGWHTFILHTRDYADFCQRLAGRFLHHEPTDPAEREAMTRADLAAVRERTIAAMRQDGFIVDEELWPAGHEGRPCVPYDTTPGSLRAAAAAGDCTQCYAGCSDSPSGPGK